MTEIFNKARQTVTRKDLRNRPTQAENKLWYSLRLKNLGVKFRRQYGVGRYILDFYSPTTRIAIEVDGDSHGTVEAMAYDAVRQQEIEALGIIFIRFTNKDILGNIEGVLSKIQEAVKLPEPPLTPPS